MEKISIPDSFTKEFKDAFNDFPPAAQVQIRYEQVYYNPPKPLPLSVVWNAAVKRCFDILFSLVLIVFLLSWLIPLLALLIKLNSRGPVFFLQKRNKTGGELFTCIKFRSMKVNSEADIKVAGENDERITSLGGFLRKYHIDELPQLINVLLGDMSIIGPRPHMVNENLEYAALLPEYNYRHTVKPGITGLAQSLGNYGSSDNMEQIRERVRLDNEYVDNWSLSLDIKILYRTALLLISVK